MIDGTTVFTWGLNDTSSTGPGQLGSGMVVTEGDTVEVNLTNNLDRAINFVVQGVLGATPTVAPGETRTYTFSAPAITANAGEKVLTRTNQTSYQGAKIDFGGLEFELIAADGRPAKNSKTVTSVYLTPGERYDLLLTMPSAGNYNANVTYYDNRGENVIGSVATTVTSL